MGVAVAVGAGETLGWMVVLVGWMAWGMVRDGVGVPVRRDCV